MQITQTASEPVTPAITKSPLIEPHLVNNDPGTLGWSLEDADADPGEQAGEGEETQPSVDASAESDASVGPEGTPVEAAKPQPSKIEEQFVELMARDRDLNKRERTLREQEREIEQRTSGMVSIADLQKDLPGVLSKAGLSFQQLVDMQLNGGKPTADTAIKALTEQVQALSAKLEQKESSEKQTAAQREQQQQVDNFKGEIQTWLDAHKSECPITAEESQIDLVFAVIENHHQETGRVLEVAEAAKYVEQHLRPQREKVWKALGMSLPEPSPETGNQGKKLGNHAEEQAAKEQTATNRTKTLTNNHHAVSTPPVERQLSDEESIARAAERLRFLDE